MKRSGAASPTVVIELAAINLEAFEGVFFAKKYWNFSSELETEFQPKTQRILMSLIPHRGYTLFFPAQGCEYVGWIGSPPGIQSHSSCIQVDVISKDSSDGGRLGTIRWMNKNGGNGPPT